MSMTRPPSCRQACVPASMATTRLSWSHAMHSSKLIQAIDPPALDTSIDPIMREIIQNALASAADEMSLALYRTAYSTIVRDCLDYSTSLCDADGQMIAQGVTIPL